MFEQSILLPEQDKKRWTFAASILVEVSAVSVLLLIPLIYTERIGLGWIQSSPLQAIGTPLPPPPKAEYERRARPTPTSRTYNPNEAPIKIPLTINMSNMDEPVSIACMNCVVGATPLVGDFRNAVVGGIGAIPPPPPTKPVAEAKKPPVETVAGPVRVSIAVQEAKIIRRVIPVYPALAKQARVQGTVKLLGVISADGRIEQLQVLSGHPLLVAAAVDAVKQWTYRPTLLNGQPVEVQAPIEVRFILSN